MDKKELTNLIMRIADCRGVSGDEEAVAQMCLGIMRKYTPDVEIKNGNVLAHFGKRTEGKPHVLIDAHLDRVGLIATYITEDGFVKADCLGGLDRRIFPAQRVIIHGSEDIRGVICTLPPHLKHDSTVMDREQIYIDTMLSPISARELIHAGDGISFDSPCRELAGGRICGAALDDRCGIACVIAAVDALGGEYEALPFSFTVMFSTQEELGERGACIGAFEVNPDISIAVDVSFAMSMGENPRKCGEMAKGCMIGFAPSLDRGLSKWFEEYAGKNDIPFQYEVMNGQTGTNADRFSVNRCGSRAVTLSIPLRYMHTPAEVIDPEDIILTSRLITAFLKEGAV